MTKPIYIHYDGAPASELPLGRSHWWGVPDMPSDYTWPTMPNPDYVVPYVSAWDGKVVESPKRVKMPFICQINLAELPDNDVLPRNGALLFFGDIYYYNSHYYGKQSIGMTLSDTTDVAVIYVPEADYPRMVRRTDGPKDIFTPVPLIFNHKHPTIAEPELQMLGRTPHLEWETWPEPCEDWLLLLQMDSMEVGQYEFNFVDCGVLCFLINPADLAKKDFSKVRAIILST